MRYSSLFYKIFIVLFSFNSYSSLQLVFQNPNLKQKFSGFLDNVLMQVDSQTFYDFSDQIIKKYNPTSDLELYSLFLKHYSKIKPSLPFYKQLKSLRNQKNILSDQILNLLKNRSYLKGVLEIGTPGTYVSSIKNKVKIKDKIYVVNDRQRLTDIVQYGGVKPYNKFVNLNSYLPISEADIPSGSVDLVICTIGLHHIPAEKIKSFVESIKRVLSSGGIFILREHDCFDDSQLALTSTAHTVFNLLIGNETLELENSEYRNFHPLSYWIDLVESLGFKCSNKRLLQKGDPTLNTLIKFKKNLVSDTELADNISQKIDRKHDDYKRDIMQTYLSSPEWNNVDSAQEYGEFINHTPFYEFPYIESIKNYWKVFKGSWKAAAKKKGNLAVLSSPYTLMNVFVGTTMTIEYLAKSFISFPIRFMYQGEEPLNVKVLVQDKVNDVQNFEDIKIIKDYKKSGLKLIEVPRYKKFLKFICSLKNSNFKLLEISGQKEIQFKVCGKKNNIVDFSQVKGCEKEYEWDIPTKKNLIYMALTVQVEEINSVVNFLEDNNLEISYVHDF